MKVSKQQKAINKVFYLELLRRKGYKPVVQGVDYHFKDGLLNFWPTTGKYFDEATGKIGLIDDLPEKSVCVPKVLVRPLKHKREPKIKTPNKFRYYNLDKRYIPDWVFSENHKKTLELINTPQKPNRDI